MTTLLTSIVLPKIPSKGAFCQLMFLEPKMKIFVQGSEVKCRELLPFVGRASEASETGGTTKTFNIDGMLTLEEKKFSEKYGRVPYDISVHVSGADPKTHHTAARRPASSAVLVQIQASIMCHEFLTPPSGVSVISLP